MSSMKSGARPPQTKTQYVYEWLRDQIVNGDLAPGQPIRQQYVAETLGVSFTPVREAIRQLESAGLVSHSANHGAAVNELSAEAIRELYLLRGVMEGLGARLAANKVTDVELAELASLHEEMADLLSDSGPSVPGRLASLSREFHAKINQIGGAEIIAPRVQEIWATFPVPRSATLWSSLPHAQQAVEAHGEILAALRSRDGGRASALMEHHVADSAAFRAPE
jgi:DNA-binding GntR family transcriptional regulator